MPRPVQQLAADLVQALVVHQQHLRRDGQLQLPGWRAVRGRGPQRRGALGGPKLLPGDVRGAVAEQHRVDPLHPSGPLFPHVQVGLQQRPALQDMRRRNPALRQPALLQQHPLVPGIGPVGLGPPLRAAQMRGLGRIGQVRRQPRRDDLLGHIPPSRAAFQREMGVLPGEPGQPLRQVLAVGRADLPAPHLPGLGIDIVEGDLLPVDIQPAYDGHRDLLKLPRTPRNGAAPGTTWMLPASIFTRLSWGGLLPDGPMPLHPAQPLTAAAGACHLS